MNNDEIPVSAQSYDEAKKKENFIEDDLTFIESDEEGNALPTKDIVKKIREDLKKCRTEKEEYLTGWQRAKADYINLQKELELVRINSSVLAREKMVVNLLPTLDSFDMAFANKEAWGKVDANWRIGIEYIYQQFLSGLSSSGIEKINEIGVTFDPRIHQSMDVVLTDDQSKDHTVEKVLQAGYKINNVLNSEEQERIIRPARVNVYEYKAN